jgi:hypothetical protein
LDFLSGSSGRIYVRDCLRLWRFVAADGALRGMFFTLKQQDDCSGIELPIYDIGFVRKRSRWQWRVCTLEGQVMMRGKEPSRAAACYAAHRALFFLLAAIAYNPLIGRKSCDLRGDDLAL